MFDLNALATVTIEEFEGAMTSSEIARELEGELTFEEEADLEELACELMWADREF